MKDGHKPMNLSSNSTRRSAGSAFVISVIVLFVLSVLGLTLMLSTSTEHDISTNYLWGEMAFYNADAALEYAKNLMAAYAAQDGDFSRALPAARRDSAAMNLPPGPPPGGVDCPDPASPGCRDHQYSFDENGNTIYIGRVLRHPLTGRVLQFDFRQPASDDVRGDLDGDGDLDLDGTVTLWVRRPIQAGLDYEEDDRVIITAEGTAPNYEGAQGGRTGSLRRLELAMWVPVDDGSILQDYSDQSRASDAGATGSQGFAGGKVAGAR